ncbi:hypothetical protein DICVIV_00004 [Dictyocaulus viviparus]|uniref:Uncharacterized protein n=1 Tax=Dictyocaulus viviparus TaxID=29172 RepID=A0A0D8YFY6_DICVI|nr:hypothetical protein DICVIV_00004 [Dictyocaulus viviparus]
MNPIFVFVVLVSNSLILLNDLPHSVSVQWFFQALNVLLDAAPLPFVTDTTCTLPAKDKQMFLDFFSKHKFPTNWDCGLENLAKGELDRAEKATKNFPLSDVAAQYYTLTSKGKDLKSALAKIPPLFLEDGEYLNRTAKLRCNKERREELVLACVIQPLYETDVDY